MCEIFTKSTRIAAGVDMLDIGDIEKLEIDIFFIASLILFSKQ